MNFNALFNRISSLNVGIIGDFCLDVYWLADMNKSLLSRETPHFPLPIVSERYSPGGAGNVACCVKELKPKSIKAIGIIGDDWRGAILQNCLSEKGINTEGIFTQKGIFTNTYIKPLRRGISDVTYEDPRIDFENHSDISQEIENGIIDLLSSQNDIDILLVCEQMSYGCITDRVRDKIISLAKQGLFVVADSRNNIAKYKYVFAKPNELEAKAATGEKDVAKAAIALSNITERTAIVTIGDKGCLIADNGNVERVDAVKVQPPIDIVGAGDAFMAAFSLVQKASEDLLFSCKFANVASAVVIKKIGTTGTASREEIEKLWQQMNFGA